MQAKEYFITLSGFFVNVGHAKIAVSAVAWFVADLPSGVRS
jgi:hypothetical protein